MATTKQLIESALRTIGVLASGEEASAAEIQDSLLIARQMVDSWAVENLLIPSVSQDTFKLVPGQRVYTIGPSGDFDTVRPEEIRVIRISSDGGGNDHIVEPVGLKQIESIPDKDSQVTFPDYYYYQSDYPLGKIILSRAPAVDYDIVISSYKTSVAIPDLTVATEWPRAYERFVRLALCVEMAPEFGVQVPNEVAASYAQLRRSIKTQNANNRPLNMSVDKGLLRGEIFNIENGP